MPFGLILILFLILILILTAEGAELAERFSLGNIFKKKEKVLPKSWQQILGKAENVAKGIFHELARCH